MVVTMVVAFCGTAQAARIFDEEFWVIDGAELKPAARALWQRHRPPVAGPQLLRLGDVAQRLDLLVTGAFGSSVALHLAQAPAPPSWLARLLLRYPLPPPRPQALAATDASAGLAAYEQVRLSATAAIVLANRGNGPEQCMQLAQERAPGGFDRVEDVFAPGELEAMAARYKVLTGLRAPEVSR